MARHRSGIARVLALGVLLLAGCTTGDPDPTGADGIGSADPMPLTLMAFNIEYGGAGVEFGSVAAAIEAAGADVVAIQEAYAELPDIAADLGWDYFDPRTQVLSRFPLLSPSGEVGGPVYVELAPGRLVAVFDVHLSSSRYGPNAVARGLSADRVLVRESQRLEEVEPVADAAERLIAASVPVFVLGDFNAPSHRDWTEAAVGSRPHVRYPLAWPVSMRVEEAGLADAYRLVHPDPMTDAGLTWPADRPFVPGYNPAEAGRPADRIDMVFAGGPAKVLDARILGEPGGTGVDVVVDPWPTDHRSVVVDVEVTPGAAGPVVATGTSLVDRGTDLTVRYAAPEADADQLALVPMGGDLAGGLQWDAPGVSGGATTTSTDAVQPGGYDVVLLADGSRELARSQVWVAAVGDETVLSTDQRTYDQSDPIVVTWSGAAGNRWDWLGVYRRDADPDEEWYILWTYTGATVSGSTAFDASVNPRRWPLAPGRYTVYLLVDDSYQEVAGADFTVR